MTRFVRALDVSASVASIAAAAVICLVLLKGRPSTESPPPIESAKGSILSPIAGTAFAQHDRNVVVFVHSSCRYCTESMPFYARLAGKVRESSGRLSLTFVSPEPQDRTVTYFSDHKVDLPSQWVATIDPRQYPFVRGTPTLVVADQSGEILDIWAGLGDEERDGRVLESLQGT